MSTDGVFRVQLSIDVPKQPAHSDKDHFKSALFLYMLAYHNKVFAGRQQTGIPTITTSTEVSICLPWKNLQISQALRPVNPSPRGALCVYWWIISKQILILSTSNPLSLLSFWSSKIAAHTYVTPLAANNSHLPQFVSLWKVFPASYPPSGIFGGCQLTSLI